MRKLVKFSWARALGSAALFAVVAVVFVVLIPSAAFGAKKRSLCHDPQTPEITSFSPTKGPVGKKVYLFGKHFDHAQRVWFRDAQGGRAPASFIPISNTTIQTFVPKSAVSGPIAVGENSCFTYTQSKKSFTVK